MGQHRASDQPGAVAPGQARTVAFLEDPASHGGVPVERIDTHISHVFVIGDRVLKLKRAMRTNFLDFRSLAQRHSAALAELEVNAASAPSIYLGLRAVRRDGAGGLTFAGAGRVVDWLVEMRTFDRAGEFDRLQAAGRLTPDLVRGLADAIAALHARARPAPGAGGPLAVAATLRQIAGAIAEADATLHAPARDWARLAAEALSRDVDRLGARARHGRVRRGHGDLHLGNICLIDGVPTLYDAIEFNPQMATSDVLYDLAFPVMDLAQRGEAVLANRLVCRYLGRTRDWSGAGLLPLFLSMRAAVRVIGAAARPGGRAAALAGLARAVAFLDPRPPARLIAVGGMSGSGKTTLAETLAPDLAPVPGALVLRSDLLRKVRQGREPEAPLPAGAYDPAERARVMTALLRDAGRALRAGATVVIDASFLDPADRAAAGALARRCRVGFQGFWLAGNPAVLADRIASRGPDASDATAAVLLAQAARDPGRLGEDWERLDATRPPDEVAALARLCLAPEPGRRRAT